MHLPIGLTFTQTRKSKNRGFNLPKWLANHEGYIEEVNKQWSRRISRANMVGADSFERAALFKKTITYTATKFLSNIGIKHANDNITLLSLCTALIRLCTATKPDIVKINSLLKRHVALSSLVSINDGGVVYDKLVKELNKLLKNAIPMGFNASFVNERINSLSGFDDVLNNDDDNNIGRPPGTNNNPNAGHSSEQNNNDSARAATRARHDGCSQELNINNPNAGHSSESNNNDSSRAAARAIHDGCSQELYINNPNAGHSSESNNNDSARAAARALHDGCSQELNINNPKAGHSSEQNSSDSARRAAARAIHDGHSHELNINDSEGSAEPSNQSHPCHPDSEGSAEP